MDRLPQPSSGGARVYLDNAATSFPKPPVVAEAMLRYAGQIGASPGRGAYAEVREASSILHRCRRRVGELVGSTSPDHVIFTLNCTDALNLAIRGVVERARRERAGGVVHVVTTAMDHNSVLRPLRALEEDRAAGLARVEVTRVPADGAGLIDAEAVARALRPETVLVAAVHASNVTGALQPIGQIGSACRRAGVPLLVDAAQSAGHVPIDVGAMGIDLLALPGHKGLLGPLGTGVLVLRPGVEHRLSPLREGGTGSRSELDRQPDDLPDRFEPGSHNLLGIAGLDAALGWLLQHDARERREHERLLTRTLLSAAGLGAPGGWRSTSEDGLRLLGPAGDERRVGVMSFVHSGIDPHEMARALEEEFGVLGRAGLHCAPLAHGALGTGGAGGGSLRLSVGPFVTEAHAEHAGRALHQLAQRAAARPSDASVRSADAPHGVSLQPARDGAGQPSCSPAGAA